MKRSIIRIDEARCNGCGQCASACAEGAIAMVDGKARLVSDIYCDGLGACIGDCPVDAITLVEREAGDFDPKAVERHIAGAKRTTVKPDADPACPTGGTVGFACPGSAARSLVVPSRIPNTPSTAGEPVASRLGNWPVQLRLVPVTAPFLKRSRLLVSADCVPFAMPGFHHELLEGRILVIGCPKVDDTAFYADKLTAIFRSNEIASVDVAYMEVPCCYGLVQTVLHAVRESGKAIPVRTILVGLQGAVQERIDMPADPAAGRPELV
jgi:ferredoxin